MYIVYVGKISENSDSDYGGIMESKMQNIVCKLNMS